MERYQRQASDVDWVDCGVACIEEVTHCGKIHSLTLPPSLKTVCTRIRHESPGWKKLPVVSVWAGILVFKGIVLCLEFLQSINQKEYIEHLLCARCSGKSLCL